MPKTNRICLPERTSKLMLAVLLLLGGVGFVLIGITVLPILGFIFALPLLAFAVYFYRAHLNERCRLEEGRH